MLKVGGLTLEEVARATSSTVGAVKQKAHRAYDRLRHVAPKAGGRRGEGSYSMNCHEVTKALAEDSPLTPQAQDHLRSCHHCQGACTTLNSPAPSDPPSRASLRQIAAGLAIGLRPSALWRPRAFFLEHSLASLS